MESKNLLGKAKRQMIKLIVVFLMSLSIISTAVSTKIYKWINDDGSMGFTDDLSKVPVKYRDQVEIMKYNVTSSPKNEDSEISEKSNQSVTNEDVFSRDYQVQEEMSSEEKEELDKKLRGMWENMRRALGGK